MKKLTKKRRKGMKLEKNKREREGEKVFRKEGGCFLSFLFLFSLFAEITSEGVQVRS